MKEQKKNLQNEQGSVQRQTQKNESYQHNQTVGESSEGKFGLIPIPQYQNNAEEEQDITSLEKKPNLEDIDDEKVIPGIKAKRSAWNSIDFEVDNFFEGLVPA